MPPLIDAIELRELLVDLSLPHDSSAVGRLMKEMDEDGVGGYPYRVSLGSRRVITQTWTDFNDGETD